jgi:hypothetical protein
MKKTQQSNTMEIILPICTERSMTLLVDLYQISSKQERVSSNMTLSTSLWVVIMAREVFAPASN